MPGREDFGKLRLRALCDPRVHDAGGRLPIRALAHVAACGVVAALGGVLARDTDDGVMPGDGVATVRAALSLSPKDAASVIATLKAAGLAKDVRGGVYLSGWNDAYGGMVSKRDRERIRKAEQRGHPGTVPRYVPRDVPRDMARDIPNDVPRDVRALEKSREEESREEESNPPKPPQGGAVGPVPSPKRARRRRGPIDPAALAAEARALPPLPGTTPPTESAT